MLHQIVEHLELLWLQWHRSPVNGDANRFRVKFDPAADESRRPERRGCLPNDTTLIYTESIPTLPHASAYRSIRQA